MNIRIRQIIKASYMVEQDSSGEAMILVLNTIQSILDKKIKVSGLCAICNISYPVSEMRKIKIGKRYICSPCLEATSNFSWC